MTKGRPGKMAQQRQLNLSAEEVAVVNTRIAEVHAILNQFDNFTAHGGTREAYLTEFNHLLDLFEKLTTGDGETNPPIDIERAKFIILENFKRAIVAQVKGVSGEVNNVTDLKAVREKHQNN